jgi:hypothetical protein
MVDALLAILCKDPIEMKDEEYVRMGGSAFKGAVIRTPKGEERGSR